MIRNLKALAVLHQIASAYDFVPESIDADDTRFKISEEELLPLLKTFEGYDADSICEEIIDLIIKC
jgi:hypothetical protein